MNESDERLAALIKAAQGAYGCLLESPVKGALTEALEAYGEDRPARMGYLVRHGQGIVKMNGEPVMAIEYTKEVEARNGLDGGVDWIRLLSDAKECNSPSIALHWIRVAWEEVKEAAPNIIEMDDE